VKFRFVVVAAAVGITFGLKRHYADARAEDLVWILGPTSRVAGLLANTRFLFEPGEGYFSRDHLFLIAKACAGVNFLVAAFGMVALALLHRAVSWTSAARVLAVSLLASYAAAVLVNATRIAVALWLAEHPVATLSAAGVHRLEGIAVYFGGLILLYALVRQLDRRAPLGLALPLAAYYMVTLVIPILGGASSASAFSAHALVVLLVPPLLILAVAGVAQAVAACRPIRQSR
jgi:exosortase K